jgi:hypothetical protein
MRLEGIPTLSGFWYNIAEFALLIKGQIVIRGGLQWILDL